MHLCILLACITHSTRWSMHLYRACLPPQPTLREGVCTCTLPACLHHSLYEREYADVPCMPAFNRRRGDPFCDRLYACLTMTACMCRPRKKRVHASVPCLPAPLLYGRVCAYVPYLYATNFVQPFSDGCQPQCVLVASSPLLVRLPAPALACAGLSAQWQRASFTWRILQHFSSRLLVSHWLESIKVAILWHSVVCASRMHPSFL